MKKRLPAALLALAVLLTAAALWWQNRRRNTAAQAQLFAMDTVMGFTAYGPHGAEAVEAAAEEVRHLDALLDAQDPQSEVARLNTLGRAPVSADTEALLRAARSAWEDTGGLFDCTVYPLVELWGFPSGNYRVPGSDEIAALLPLVDGGAVSVSAGEAALGPGQRVDLGGIAKGYTAARIMELYRARGVSSGMVTLGGNVQVLGSRPDGSPWRIGIRDPESGVGDTLAVLSVTDEAVVTSGGYERYFEEGGQTYIHILDPRTGCPAQSDLLSATAVSPDGTLADVLSTTLFLLGREGAADYWRASGGDFEMLLVGPDSTLFVTQGLADRLETDRPVEVIRRD